MTTDKIIQCKNRDCDRILGFEEERDGRRVLRLGDIVVTHITGACDKCGWPFHWETPERKAREELCTNLTETL